MTQPGPEKSRRKRDSNPGSSAPEADALTTRPARQCSGTGGNGLQPRKCKSKGSETVKNMIPFEEKCLLSGN